MTRSARAGAAGEGLFAHVRVAEIALRSAAGWTAVGQVFAALRISPHTDPNAAGSFYVLFAVPALFWAISARSWLSVAVVPPLLGALWLTRSRTALIACVVAAAAVWMIARRWSWRGVLIGGAAGAAALAVLVAVGFGRSESAEPAMHFRADMARVSIQLAARQPLFGIGLDEFQTASVSLITPEAIARFPPAARGENAHNNFLQILVELGAAGLLAFLWLLLRPAAAFIGALRRRTATSEAIGLAGGVSAFVLTCLAGHPLLVAPVAVPFFVVLGLFAASLPPLASDRGDVRARRVAATALLLLAIIVAFRLAVTI
jgi:O-antigen ligase